VVGGNLSILYSLLGSRSQIDTRGKILLVEDLDEYLYHIDRMMQALSRAGMLDGLKALIVGGMTDMHDNTIPFGRTPEQIVLDAVGDRPYPVIFDAPFGHLGDNNLALPLGMKINLEVSDSKKCRIFAP
jgi:muramoyltetrapeptide carboxypeptidase